MIACLAAGGATAIAYILMPMLRHRLGAGRFMELLTALRVAWRAAAEVFRHVEQQREEEANETDESK